MAAFLQSPLAARMREAKKLLREYDFITAVPAKFVDDTLPEPFAHQPVLVQGIADAVLVNGDTAEIADYKTDRGKTPEQLLQAYAKQLLLYRAAVEKRLGVRVERCTIYSFSLGREIPVPLERLAANDFLRALINSLETADILVPATKKRSVSVLENTMQKTGLAPWPYHCAAEMDRAWCSWCWTIFHYFSSSRRGTAFVFAAGAAFCRAVSVLPDRGLHPHP